MPAFVAVLLLAGMALVFANPYSAEGYILVLFSACVAIVSSSIMSQRVVHVLREELAAKDETLEEMASQMESLRSRNEFLESAPRGSQPSERSGSSRELSLARLGFPPGYEPTEEQVRSARIRALKMAHPDNGGVREYAGEVLQKIDEAAKILK